MTGARSGLGRAFASALAAEGLRVTGTSRRSGSDAFDMPPEIAPLHLDFAQDGVEAFIGANAALLDEVDILVNNAGAGVFGPVEEIDPDALREQMESLAVAPLRLAQRVFKPMRARGRGTIVNVSSLAAEFPIPFMAPYNAAKAALSQGTRSLMLEARGTGVTVIDLQPGDFRTDFNTAMQRADEGDESRVLRVLDMVERHLQAGPPPEAAARALVRALRRGRSGTVRCGGWMQVCAAPLARRLFGDALMRRAIARYYRLDA